MARMQALLPIVRLAAAALLAAAGSAVSAAPGILYDLGGTADRSFNQAAREGAERWRAESGKAYLEAQPADATQREPMLRALVERGADPIVVLGFAQKAALEQVARAFPQRRFAIVDATVDLPNVQSILFREHEGSFLVGMMAAMASRTGTVGFVGGMDSPLIRRFQCGYEQGARHVDPKATVRAAMAGTTPAAWTDPPRGAALAREQFAAGADVVFAAAGLTGIGVYQAARDAGRLAIGVDVNQNGLQPGTLLTSMVKRIDVAVYRAFAGTRSGTVSLGLKEGGVDYAMDENNAPLVTAQMQRRVDAAKAAIVAGSLPVADYAGGVGCR
jgi:basic membrane protein A